MGIRAAICKQIEPNDLPYPYYSNMYVLHEIERLGSNSPARSLICGRIDANPVSGGEPPVFDDAGDPAPSKCNFGA